MNRLFLALLTISLLTLPHLAEARRSSDQIQPYTQEAAPNENDLEAHGHYTNKEGKTVHSPSKSKSGAVPAGASAQCRDGSYSFSHHRSGTCSHHGGVGRWLN